MNKKTSISLIILYIVALGLLFAPFFKQALIIVKTQTTTVERSSLKQKSKPAQIETIQPPTLTDVLAVREQPIVQAEGQVTIPSIAMTLPVFSDVTNDHLLVGAGDLFPEREASKQNVVLIGHHLGRRALLFGNLLTIQLGDQVYLQRQNKVYQYKIEQLKTVEQTELAVLENHHEASLTLITCDKPTQTKKRFVVKGSLVSDSIKPADRRVIEQVTQIKQKNTVKNLRYCVVIGLLFLSLLIIGSWFIYQNSK